MKKLRLFVVSALACLAAATSAWAQTTSKPVKVDFENCVIVSSQQNHIVVYAVEELKNHIKLVSGVDVPIVKKYDAKSGKYPIHVGIKPPGDTKELQNEEARWILTANKGIYLYGKDTAPKAKGAKSSKDAALNSNAQAGTLFAVYEFLEGCLGIRWVEPGDKGIACTPMQGFAFEPVLGNYIPKLAQRHMRTAYKADLRARALQNGNIPDDMKFTDAEFAQRYNDELVWRRRMRMGSPTIDFKYGHAFTKWWAKYGETHPEYFAMNKNGKRGPSGKSRADRVKLCVSNPDLARQVVADHFAATPTRLVVNATENDSREFCNCDKCKALDVVLPGEENLPVDDRHLTDRYVHFFNAVLREARKVNPNAKVVCYAYSRYNEPPRREKLDDGVIIMLLPNLGDTFSFEKYCADWKAAGAHYVFMRTNDLNQDTGLPHGFEQRMFAKFKTSTEYLDLVGTDYDTCFGFWAVSGVANYTMARAFYRPERSFEDWQREYCGAFGDAAADMNDYYTYWRGIWNNRVMPNIATIGRLTEGYKLLRSKLTHLTDLLYEEADFDKTDAILQTALARKNLAPWAKAKIENQILANKHNRLSYRAHAANRMASTAPVEQQKATAQALYDFRRAHRLDLNMHWELLMWIENAHEDSVGLKRLQGTESKRLYNWRIQEEAKIKAARGDYNIPLR